MTSDLQEKAPPDSAFEPSRLRAPYVFTREEDSSVRGQPPLARVLLLVEDDSYYGQEFEEYYLCSSDLDDRGPGWRDELQVELDAWEAAGLEVFGQFGEEPEA